MHRHQAQSQRARVIIFVGGQTDRQTNQQTDRRTDKPTRWWCVVINAARTILRPCGIGDKINIFWIWDNLSFFSQMEISSSQNMNMFCACAFHRGGFSFERLFPHNPEKLVFFFFWLPLWGVSCVRIRYRYNRIRITGPNEWHRISSPKKKSISSRFFLKASSQLINSSFSPAVSILSGRWEKGKSSVWV